MAFPIVHPTWMEVFTAPRPDPGRTQVPSGLYHDGASIWITNFDLAPWNIVYRVDETGAVLSSFQALDMSGNVCFPRDVSGGEGEFIYVLVRYDGIAGNPGPAVIQYDLLGNAISSFPTTGVGIPAGVAWDGSGFWVTSTNRRAGTTTPERARKFAADGTILETIDLTFDFQVPLGMDWKNDRLWIAENVPGSAYDKDVIFVFDPVSLAVTEAWMAPANVVSGVTWNGNVLWVSDSQTDLVYKIGVGIPPLRIFQRDDTMDFGRFTQVPMRIQADSEPTTAQHSIRIRNVRGTYW